MQIKIGFVDNSQGANLRTLPAELPGSKTLTTTPLLPGTRVLVRGTHPQSSEWSYVVAIVGGYVLRGYIQSFRITTELPEPAAILYTVTAGDCLEPIAARLYHQGIEPGRDLRFYENVVLYVNQKAGRVGVQRRDGDVRLVEGRRIWLVSLAFANKLQGIVSSGSITAGAFARARQVGQHLEDVLASVMMAPDHIQTVGGEYAHVILENLPEIITIVAAFLAAECISVFLATTPTGVGQLAAAVIQLGLAAYGVQGMVEAGVEALKHAREWITLSWQANGDVVTLSAASKSFLRMLMSIAMAALAKLGVKSNLGRGLKLAQGVKITPPSLVMMQAAGLNGEVVAVPVFSPGSITATSSASLAVNPMTGLSAAISRSVKKLQPKEMLEDVELEKLLEKLPNWEQIKQFVGRRIPDPGTPEFAAFKQQLEKAGYQLDIMTSGEQPFRLRRLGDKSRSGDYAPLSVTDDGMIVINANSSGVSSTGRWLITVRPSRISVYSRYRKNYLEWVEETYGKEARAAAAARVSAGDQLHHLIPDAVAQRHPLIREALKRLEGYTIDSGMNILDMPGAQSTERRIMHLGSHPEYNKYVISKLDQAMQKLGSEALRNVKPQRLHELILKVETELRKAIESGTLPEKVLKEIKTENGIIIGRKLALLDPRHDRQVFTA